MILSQHVEFGIATRVLAEDPERLGYLLKDRVTDVEEFVATLRRVASGGTALDPQVVSRLLAAGRDDGPLASLTPREREVLGLIAEGLTNQAIAERTRDHAAQRGEARVEHLRQARPARQRQRAPPRARCAALPRRLTRRPAPHPRGTAPRDTGGPDGGAGRRVATLAASKSRSLGGTMQTVLVQAERPDSSSREAVVTARDVVRRYGEGDTAVDALRGVSVDISARPPDRRHGPVGLGQVDADAHPRRPRQADLRRGHRRRRRHQRPWTTPS